MLNILVILFCKLIVSFSKAFNLGSGSTWPGHIALNLNPNFIPGILQKNPQLKIILIAGTNGKTTTTKLLEFILLKNEYKVFRNAAGANLLNGIASTLIQHSTVTGKLNYDVALFEVDENTLPLLISQLSMVNCQLSLVLLNLFRDQLDRYGEINTIAKNWQESLKHVKESSLLFVNGDDPQLTYIAEISELKTRYFGLNSDQMSKKDIPHDVDFLYCPKCNTKLVFSKMSYSHMGIFRCPKCHFKRKEVEKFSIFYPLFGTYNIYNTNAAALVAHTIFSLPYEQIKNSLADFKPAFGRQEVIEYNGKKIIILLSKNPTGFNQSIEAVNSLMGKHTILLVLNDKIPDGRDVSWIWDVDFEELVKKNHSIVISGDRCYDMGLRIQYSQEQRANSLWHVDNKTISHKQSAISQFEIIENLQDAVSISVSKTTTEQILFVLATYSAMLEVRKIITGKKLL